jgi:Fe-S-cluster containining protein
MRYTYMLFKTLQFLIRAVFFGVAWIIETFQKVETRFVHLFKKPEYERRGGCQGVGACCKKVGMVLPAFLTKRNWAVRYFSWWHDYRYNFNYLGQVDAMLVYECRYLTKDNRCSIYRFRPRLCREYPKEQLWGFPKVHKGCGFSFAKPGSQPFSQVLSNEMKKN